MGPNIVICIPPERMNGMFGHLGRDELLAQLNTHPDARVVIVNSAAELDEVGLDADALLLGWGSFWAGDPTFVIPPAALGGRLRWVHSISGLPGSLLRQLRDAPAVTLTWAHVSYSEPTASSRAEHALAMILALSRDLPGSFRAQSAHEWRGSARSSPTFLEGKTAAIIGIGSPGGGDLAHILRVGFGMQVLGMVHANDEPLPAALTDLPDAGVHRHFCRSELLDVLAEADIVAVTLDFTVDGVHLLDRAAFTAMKRTALVVNVSSSGAIIDEAALIDALKDGSIAGAALDVFEEEPLPADSPLWTFPNVVITNRCAGVTDAVANDIVDDWCQNIRRFANGEPLPRTVSWGPHSGSGAATPAVGPAQLSEATSAADTAVAETLSEKGEG